MNEIKKLIDSGMTKYAIAKELDVAWNTVHLWEHGMWKPTKQNAEKVKELWRKRKGGGNA